MTFKDRDFLKLLDFTPEEIEYLIDFAASLKAKKKAGIPHKICDGKNVALIFEKTSTRTRCSFEVAARLQLTAIQRLLATFQKPKTLMSTKAMYTLVVSIRVLLH